MEVRSADDALVVRRVAVGSIILTGLFQQRDELKKNRATTLALIAVIHAALGALASVFPGPVGAESSFMPAVAIALYACLQYGRVALLAVMPAALLVGVVFDPAFVGVSGELRFAGELMLALTAAGQAAMGAWVVRHHVPYWRSLTGPLAGVRMLVVAVVLSTLPWALMRLVLRLLIDDVAPGASEIFFSAWLAQMIGMVALLPVAMVLGFRQKPLWKARLTTLALPASVLILLVLGAHLFASRLENNRREEVFASLADETGASLRAAVDDNLRAATSASRFIESASALTRESFDRFNTPLVHGHSGLSAIAWVPMVRASELARFVQEARAEVGADFAIRDLAPDGSLVPAAKRPVHFPVRYVVPEQGNEGMPGFDVASEAARRWALVQAQRSDRRVVTEPLDPFDVAGKGASVLVIVPVHGADVRQQGARTVVGVAVSAVDVDAMLNRVLAEHLADGMGARLVDVTVPSDPAVLFVSADIAAESPFDVSRAITVENRQWVLEIVAGPGFLGDRSWAVMWLVMSGSLVLLVLMQGYLLTVSGQSVAVNLEVAERTRQLREEVEKREAVAATLRHSEARMRGVFDTVVDGLVIIDAQGTIDAFNPAAERIFGWTADEVIGKNVRVLMPEPYHSAHDGYLEDYHRTGRRKIIGIGRTVEGKRKDGSVFPLDLAVTPFHIDSGVMFAGVTRDASERVASAEQIKAFNAQLRDMVSVLEQRDHALTELARVNEELMACNDQSEAGGVIQRAMETLFPGSAGMLAISRGSMTQHRLSEFVRWGAPDGLGGEMITHDCWALRQGKAHTVGDKGSALRCKHVAESFGDYTCLPLVVQGVVQGLITVRQPSVNEREHDERRRSARYAQREHQAVAVQPGAAGDAARSGRARSADPAVQPPSSGRDLAA